jgi:adenylate cyclase
LFIGIAGVLISVLPLGSQLEDKFGLDLLFILRGVRPPPADVIIVSIDKESADELNLPDDPRKWPRSICASLTEKLSSAGVAVVAFDVFFAERQSSKEDNFFAQALRRARNTILCECLKVENVLLQGKRGLPGEKLLVGNMR